MNFRSNRRRPAARLYSRLVWCCALIGLTVGCHPLAAQICTRPLTGYVSPSVSHLPLGRAIFLPTENQTKHLRYEETFHELLETELRSLQLFHVVDCPANACGAIDVPQLYRSAFPMAKIAELRKRYNVDMIIASSITEFQPYRYPKVGIDLHIIETANAETIASFSGVWDSRNEAITQQACQHFRSSSRGGPLCNAELVLQSPRYFTEYVTRDLALGLADLWNAQTGTVLRLPIPREDTYRSSHWPLVGRLRTRLPKW